MTAANEMQNVNIQIKCGSVNGNGDDDDDQSVQYRNKVNVLPHKTASLDITNRYMNKNDLSAEDLLHQLDLDEYGSTPPRTRIKIKNRDWDRKQKMDCATKAIRGITRMARCRANRRNTMDCAILNQIFIDDDSKRSDKRSTHLLRTDERDQKLASIVTTPPGNAPASNVPVDTIKGTIKPATVTFEERKGGYPVCRTRSNAMAPKVIESCNRYMSVISRPIGCRASAPATAFIVKDSVGTDENLQLKSRQDFHDNFSNVVKLGSSDKQDCKISNEDHTWQTELKDLIWLELQAWHADRTLEQQDKYLYSARQRIPDLLNKILNYRFTPRFVRGVSVASTDSGISSDGTYPQTGDGETERKITKCQQCYSMYCKDCQEQQTVALREVEELLTRLEAAEALYPSSQVLASFYPVYKSPEFVGRVKAMCLWYNMTKHQRLKLLIVGKIFARLQGKQFQWPMSSTDQQTDSPSLSTHENDDSGRDSVESRKVVSAPTRIPKVKFTCDGDGDDDLPSSPNDSADSSKEPVEYMESIDLCMNDYQNIFRQVDLYSVQHLPNFDYEKFSTSPYRKYIEHVLKSRGLGQALYFLHHLHNVLLRKAHASLEVPGTEESDLDFDGWDENISYTEIPLDKEQEEELHRYGIWSSEAAAQNLPSYVPAFVFLSVMPLEVMHEYLRMRLESKPVVPNPLSLEQLMKELREGLILAMTHRERFSKHIQTAFYDKETMLEKYTVILDNYDVTVKNVLRLYLEYVEQWVLVASPEGHRKSALDREWMFTKLICPMIPNQHAIAAKKFCQIVSNLLQNTGERLITRSQDLEDQMRETSDCGNEEKRWQILTVCRDIQALFTIEREKSMRLLNFIKSLCRDIEKEDFHRDHDTNGIDFICQEVKDAVTVLQRDVLSVRYKLTKIIERVQERCDVKYLVGMEETDKLSVLSRAREILHQGYKFGFEYHKDMIRLFESKLVSCKDKSCESNLSIGVINFAKMWMDFVTIRCEPGRGVRPRWAAQGLDFLILASDPSNTNHLTQSQFNELKIKMDACIAHVVGVNNEPEPMPRRPSPRSRKVSPSVNRPVISSGRPSLSPRVSADQRHFLNQMVKEDASISPISAPNTPELVRKQTSIDQIDSTQAGGTLLRVPKLNNYGPALRQIRVRDATNRLEMELENKMREKNLIGQVKTLNNFDKIQIRARSVNFSWHRGIKIGQGRFGKVYTAVNNSTGELMAMKEITIQPGETRAIKNVAEELKIFEGISHKHLVKLYGVEIHREELLIFMELCSEGTLESLVEMSGGLYEGLTRRYTAQLLDAVAELHRHGVVHRDIKPANIFLTKSGHCLKLGDFGSAVKIQAHTTVPGELQGYVGTQSYMAPEVFTKNHTDGHGRAADIWSVGCVVIEMASGIRPWNQFDSNFQIMFKVGMGESPDIPDTLSDEGQEFVEHCLQHDPKERWLATDLLQHHFCKVGLGDFEEGDGKNFNSLKIDSRRIF